MEYSKEFNDIFLARYRELENLNPQLYGALKKNFRIEFETFRNLRNSLTHDEVNGEYPFVVSDAVVAQIEGILELATVKAIDICTSLEELVTVKLNTTFQEAFEIMHERGFSYLPILDRNNRVIAVVSEKGIIAYLARETFHKDALINDYKRYFLLNSPFEKFGFVGKKATLDVIRLMFERNKNTKKCELIFVTENGDSEEAVLGILTPHDVI